MIRRGIAQHFSDLKRLHSCGRGAYGEEVSLRLSDGRAGVAGVMTCGSVWACSVCSAKIAAERQAELARGLKFWWDDGGDVVFLTLTMRHNKGHRLSSLWEGLSHAWGRVTSGKTWQTEKAVYGLAGYNRVVEVTHGANGWHVHAHILLFVKRPSDALAGMDAYTASDLARWKQSMFSRWVSGLEKHGLTALDTGGQQDIRLVERYRDEQISRYVTKQVDNGDAIAFEQTHGATKDARATGSRTAFGILDSLIATADPEELRLWNEFEAASLGKRQMTWSRGLRELLRLGAERTDEEIAEEEVGSADDDKIAIPGGDWYRLSANGEAVADVLEALERDGVAACLALLAFYGVRARVVDADNPVKPRFTGEQRMPGGSFFEN